MRLLVFKIWSILHMVDFDACDLKDWRDFCEHAVEACERIPACSHAPLHCGHAGVQPRCGVWGQAPMQFFLVKWINSWTFFTKFQKCSYLHERSRIRWNEWKINLPIFATFSLWDMVVFVLIIGQFFDGFWAQIDHNSINKNCKNRKINYLFVSEHCATIWT